MVKGCCSGGHSSTLAALILPSRGGLVMQMCYSLNANVESNIILIPFYIVGVLPAANDPFCVHPKAHHSRVAFLVIRPTIYSSRYSSSLLPLETSIKDIFGPPEAFTFTYSFGGSRHTETAFQTFWDQTPVRAPKNYVSINHQWGTYSVLRAAGWR